MAAVAFVAITAACAGQAPMLNSERIEQTFGNYGIEVLSTNDHQRIASLYSMKDGRRTTRTYAQTRFAGAVDEAVDDAVREEHALIAAGASIGATFKSRGWRVTRRGIRLGSRRLTAADAEIAALMRLATPQTVAVHEYLLVVTQDGRSIDYATITEIHHPDYLTPADLARIYR